MGSIQTNRVISADTLDLNNNKIRAVKRTNNIHGQFLHPDWLREMQQLGNIVQKRGNKPSILIGQCSKKTVSNG